VEEAAKKDAEIVFETEMEILRKSHINSEKGTSRVEMLGISGVVFLVGRNCGRQ
jgi:hypothetical protein